MVVKEKSERNILGLPSITGFTPLKSGMEGEVAKYDFKGIGPIVLDKSGHGNGLRLKPLWPMNSPRRKTVSLFPLKRTLVFDGEDDYADSGISDSLNINSGEIEVLFRAKEEQKWPIPRFVGIGTGHDNRVELLLHKGTRPRLFLMRRGETVVDIFNKEHYNDNQLHRAVGRWSENGAELIVDGEMIGTATGDKSSYFPANPFLRLGAPLQFSAEEIEERGYVLNGELRKVIVRR